MKLKFANKAKSIVYVYKHGPSSCMKGSKRVRAYAGGDLAVAYLRDEGEIVARAVVWPKKKWYYTIYSKRRPYGYNYDYSRYLFIPDYESLMRKALKKAGYKRHRLVGARLAKIPAKPRDIGAYKGYVVPSVDGRRGFKLGTKYITIL